MNFLQRLFRCIAGWFRKRREQLPDGLVPIVIGVTGHRNIDSADPFLAGLVKRELSELAERYPNTPFLLLSGLAEGADRLVAHVALETLPHCELIAVLPMPRAAYERDFGTEASRAEFARLIARADSVVEITPPEGEAWREDGEPRNMLYAKAGAAIAEQSQMLFALWDGERSRGTGGTADVVAWFRAGIAPKRFSFHADHMSPLDPPEPGLLIHVNPLTRDVVRDLTKTREGRDSQIYEILRRTWRYNRDVLRNLNRFGPSWPLLSEGRSDALAAKAPGVPPLYRCSDALAVRMRDMLRSYDKWFYGLILLAFILYNLRDASRGHFLAPYAIAGYLIAGVVAAAVWLWVSRRQIDQRFLEYRALAEAMRVAFFWRLAGISRPA